MELVSIVRNCLIRHS